VKVAGFHAVVLWHPSQACVVGTWAAGLPVAVEPLWQVAHEPGVTPACVKVAGFQAAVRWHASQACVVGTWAAGLPVAVEPLWQVAHEPGVTPACVKVAGFQAAVRWHASHAAVVTTWPAGLPAAFPPSWQLAQLPGATPACVNVAGVQADGRWHRPQGAWVATCSGGFAVCAKRLPGEWQEAHSRGVPRKSPCTWQLSQRTCWCAPRSGNPVVMWSKPLGAGGAAAATESHATANAAATRHKTEWIGTSLDFIAHLPVTRS
jgi:hypothetical protein